MPRGFGKLRRSFLKIRCVTVGGKKKNPIFIQNPVSQSPSLSQGGGFKVFDARGRKIFLREYFFKNFVTTYGTSVSAPERLFVTTYGTSVRRKRVNVLELYQYSKGHTV